MDRKDFESLLNNYPDCVSDGKKLKAFLKDLYPDVPKAIVNTLTIMADDGIISEMQMSTASSLLVSARLQKKLEDDYGLSQKIIAECFSLIIYDNAKQTKSTINARSHENINVSAHTTSKSASKKENFPKNTTKSGEKPLSQSIPAKGKTTKQTNTNFAGNPKDFEIVKGVLKKYKGSSSVVVIPDSVTSIGGSAFSYCKGLTSVTIPDSVTSIGDFAFSDCTGLTSVTIGNSVTSIGSSAFWDCTGLKSITIPDSVTSIDNNAFNNCKRLTNVTIPDSVTSIGDWAFYDCTGLTSITIPDSVTSIGDWAFRDCHRLTSVTIGGSVTSIGEGAFFGCNNLQDIYITDIAAWCNISELDNLIKYGVSNKKLYINNELVTSITIPNMVTDIPSYAFYNCIGLTSVTIPDSVTNIGDSAFYGCCRLIEVYNKSTLSITAGSSSNGYVAYYAENVYINEGGSKLTTDENGYVIYTDGDEKILIAYHGTNTELALPSYITKINQYAFYNCNGLTSVTIEGSVTSIGDSAFRDCTGLTSITIPDSVTSIGRKAFHRCRNLTIYCEAESKPIGWGSGWNPGYKPVVWGFKN